MGRGRYSIKISRNVVPGSTDSDLEHTELNGSFKTQTGTAPPLDARRLSVCTTRVALLCSRHYYRAKIQTGEETEEYTSVGNRQ